MTAYARFRADPSKVRVSICRTAPDEWRVTITLIGHPEIAPVVCRSATPRHAITRALAAASRARLPGIDRDLQWAYDHPHGAARGEGVPVWQPQPRLPRRP